MKQKGTLRLIAGLQALAAVTGMLAAGIISVGAEEKAMTAAKTVWSFRELLEADTSFAVEGIYTEDSPGIIPRRLWESAPSPPEAMPAPGQNMT